MGCTDDAGDSRWYLPRCAEDGCNWDVNHEGERCWIHRQRPSGTTSERGYIGNQAKD